MERRKPRLLIIGHGRHGKDTVAEMISEVMDLDFISSSIFVGQECIWPMWGKERYASFEEMFEDRVNFRSTWRDLILAYNTPDLCRTVRGMFAKHYDMYVGMRSLKEFQAVKEAKLIDYVIWVDASGRLPLEPKESMELNSNMADIFIDNNGPEANLYQVILNLQERLHNEGYEVGTPPEAVAEETVVMEEEQPKLDDRKAWEEMPEGAVQVLDHGFFQIKEVMGSDASICDAARMSYGRGTKKVNDNQGLINYLVRNHHTSPLEMGEIKFHMRLPIFVMRQLVRHRTANLNEYSGRYSEMVRLFYVPDTHLIREQHTINKQGSDQTLPLEEAHEAQCIIEKSSNNSFDDYEELLRRKVSRETARIVLPLNTYTEVVWKLDVSNLIKFLYLRDDPHSQWEIQVYAKLISDAVEQHFPQVFTAYKRERESVKLTPLQIESLITGMPVKGMSKSEQAQITELFDNHNGVDIT